MDISADKYESEGNNLGLFLAVLHTLSGIIREMIGFFTLTEGERLEAGVVIGNQWRDG
ncbi:MAG: hypothetical protein JXB38_04580 [Anaerolineales bacterium]|nr:hypothetical protein [Anaerolineales bacterium]